MPQNTSQLPPIEAILNFAFAAAIGVACAGIAGILLNDGGRAIAGGLVGMLLGLSLTATYYWGLFHRNSKCLFAAALLIVPASMCLGAGVYRLLADSLELPELFTWFLLPIGTHAAFFGAGLASLWQTVRWYNMLKDAEKSSDARFGIRSISLREMLGATVVLGVVMAPASIARYTDPLVYLENVPASQAPVSLPAEAKELKFYRHDNGLVESTFLVEEKDLKKWLAELRHDKSNFFWRPRPMPQGYREKGPVGYPDGKIHYEWFTFDDAVYVRWDEDNWQHSLIYSPSQKRAIYDEHWPRGW